MDSAVIRQVLCLKSLFCMHANMSRLFELQQKCVPPLKQIKSEVFGDVFREKDYPNQWHCANCLLLVSNTVYICLLIGINSRLCGTLAFNIWNTFVCCLGRIYIVNNHQKNKINKTSPLHDKHTQSILYLAFFSFHIFHVSVDIGQCLPVSAFGILR